MTIIDDLKKHEGHIGKGKKHDLERLHKHLSIVLTILGSGRHRVAYIDPKNPGMVLKVPKSFRHFKDSISEVWQYQRQQAKGPGGHRRLAKCELATIWGVPCVLMERVSYVKPDDKLPDWAVLIDQREVGYDKDGNLVAFDYA